MHPNIPYLSYEEIDTKASLFLNEFDLEIIENTHVTPLELLIEKSIGFDLDYQYLSHNQYYLGRTVFNEETIVCVYDKHNHNVNFIKILYPSILIEQSLIENNDPRYRFTLAHELGHAVLHKNIYYENKDQLSLFDVKQYERNNHFKPLTKHDLESLHNENNNQNITKQDWIEWQANTFASCILIPKKSLLNFYYKNHNNDNTFVKDVSKKFDTSYLVAQYRINKLGLL